MTRWAGETLHPHFRCSMIADRALYENRTEHQHLIIFDNATFGRVMMLDGVVQLTTKDEFIYHEMMAHVPLF
jgi:spermidine synthase